MESKLPISIADTNDLHSFPGELLQENRWVGPKLMAKRGEGIHWVPVSLYRGLKSFHPAFWVLAYLVLPCFTLLCFIDVLGIFVFVFCLLVLQTEGKTLYQQQDYDSLYWDTCFIAVVWNGTHNIYAVPLKLISLLSHCCLCSGPGHHHLFLDCCDPFLTKISDSSPSLQSIFTPQGKWFFQNDLIQSIAVPRTFHYSPVPLGYHTFLSPAT